MIACLGDEEGFFGFVEQIEDRPGRVERANLICQLEDELRKATSVLAKPKMYNESHIKVSDKYRN